MHWEVGLERNVIDCEMLWHVVRVSNWNSNRSGIHERLSVRLLGHLALWVLDDGEILRIVAKDVVQVVHYGLDISAIGRVVVVGRLVWLLVKISCWIRSCFDNLSLGRWLINN